MKREHKDEPLKDKIKKKILAFLLGVFGSFNVLVIYNHKDEIKKQIESNKKQKFLECLKVENTTNEDIVKEILASRNDVFSKDTGCSEQVRKIIQSTLEQIDENFEINSMQKGILSEMSKEEYKKNFIQTILKVDDIVYTTLDEMNQYTFYFLQHPTTAAFFTYVQSENELGIIPPNTIVILDGENIEYTILHEAEHVNQAYGNSEILTSYTNVISMLKEGQATNNAYYIRNINLDSINNVSEDAYKLSTIIYNKLEYLIGEKELDEYMHTQNIDVCKFLCNKLDGKYGDGTGEKFYKCITNLQLWFDQYSEQNILDRIENDLQELNEKNEFIRTKIENGEQSAKLDMAYSINNNYAELLNSILDLNKKIEDGVNHEAFIFESSFRGKEKEELRKLEKLTLKCISKDIENISSKNEAIDYIQLWDYYRHRCSIGRNREVGEEATNKDENFNMLLNVQHRLFKKCMEYKALNICDEKVFDKLIEAQLCDTCNASVIDGTNNMKILDEYLINSVEIYKADNGKKIYIWDVNKNKEGKASGIKIVADKEIENER